MIAITLQEARLCARADDMLQHYDRIPFAYEHTLSDLDLFGDASLCRLAEKYDHGDYFVASGAQSPATGFYDVAHGKHSPKEALARLESANCRILMKRPEKHDRRFREMLDALFEQVLQLRPELRGERLARLDSSILISSAAAITPFHFDPEISFFFQIQGEKTYHLYEPRVMTERELERFYVKGIVNIGQASLENRDQSAEHVFLLGPGKGMHQPKNAPHWVETQKSRSISYVFSFETQSTRALGRARSFNHYQRAMGLRPAFPGTHPQCDALKAKAIELITPLRKTVGTRLRRTAGVSA